MTEATWVRVARFSALAENQPTLVVVYDRDVVLYRVGEEAFATEDLCSHADASLSEGDQEGYVIHCPRHGGQFDIRTGAAVHFPAVSPIEAYPVKIDEQGDVWIDLEP